MRSITKIGKFGRVSVACLIVLQACFPFFVRAQSAAGDPAREPAGLINSVSGSVYARTGTGEEVLLKPGDVFPPGTTFRTSGDGNVVLLFADGQNVTLNPNSTLRVDDYFFDPKEIRKGKSSLSLLSGVMSLVTGAIHTGNPQGLSFSMGDTSIAISSKDVTAFTAQANSNSETPGFVAVTIGEIAVTSKAGPPTAVGADQFVRWQAGLPPSPPGPIAAAPAIFQALVSASQASVLPSNNPVDIQSVSLQVALASLATTSAGTDQQAQQAQSVASASSLITPSVTPGGGRGCVGSPC